MANTIVALATAPLKSALAIIRVSGDTAFEITEELSGIELKGLKKRSSFRAYLHNNGENIDDVVFLAYPNPNSMTGEDVVEIFCHGSMLIANEIIGAYLSKGAAYATRGEFTMRGYLNGKMDLVEAEAVNDLINATNKESKNLSLLSLEGKTSHLLSPVKEELGELLALVEVNIDFPEYEDLEEVTKEKILSKGTSIKQKLDELIQKGEEGKIIKDGIKIAIVGEPNVGKSSILNAILEEEKAIVSNIPGTTRDVVEGEISYKGVLLHLLDTAGMRESADQLENLGIERSKKAMDEADLVILVKDATDDESEFDVPNGKDLITVYNKDDLASDKKEGRIYISALNKKVRPLLDAIVNKLGLSEESFVNPSLNSTRQLSLLRKASDAVGSAMEEADADAPIDLISEDLQRARLALQDILGELPNRDLTDEIFSRFCVGK